ncbi:MAG: xylulokinase, partial [Acidobacteria bacterium]|nr:xylulokinase [Acidobacteriota bacterium]
PKDYIRLRLTGDKATDAADASGTLLFDVRNRKWSDEMLEEFQIEKSLMPRVYESIEVTGSVSRSASEATGLKTGTAIIAGAGDNAAGAVGMGVTRPGTVSVTIGTSGVVFGVTEQPKLDLKGRIHTLCHAIPGRWHNTGVTLAAGLSLKWFRQNLAEGKSFNDLDDEAAAIQAGSDGALWLPYLMGERTPHLDPQARAAFVGLTASHTRPHLTRAIMEGVAFSLRDSLEIFKETGAEVSSIRLGGGGATSHIWRAIQASVYGRSVEILEADQGAAFGAAILAGVGAGAWNSVDEACERSIRVAETVEPDAESIGILDRAYEAYKMLYSALAPAMKTIAKANA